MKNFTLFTLFLLCVCLAPSCSEDVNDSWFDADLKVSTNEVTFDKTGGVQTFEVTVNKNNNYVIQCINPVEWGIINKEGEVVTVSLEPNTTSVPRSTTIHVFSLNGGKEENVKITQSGDELIFNVETNLLAFNRLGGEKIVKVSTNSTNWSVVESGAEWVSHAVSTSNGELSITAQEYKGDVERETVIIIKNGIQVQNINITQGGIKELILPYMNFGCDLQKVLRFEQDRGFIYQYVPTIVILGALISLEQHNILTLSTTTPKLTYAFEDQTNQVYNKATVFNTINTTNPSEVQQFFDDYSQLLLDNGFVKPAGEFVKDIEVNGLSGFINVNIYIQGAIFELILEQRTSYPTFDAFPYGFMEWDTDGDAVRAHETTLGGTFDEKESIPSDPDGKSMMVFTPSATDKDFGIRAYHFKGVSYVGYTQSQYIYLTMSKFAYVSQDKPFLTKEYVELLGNEGFEYHGTLGARIMYKKLVDKGTNRYLFAAHSIYVKEKFVSLNIWEEVYENEAAPAISNLPDTNDLLNVGPVLGTKYKLSPINAKGIFR